MCKGRMRRTEERGEGEGRRGEEEREGGKGSEGKVSGPQIITRRPFRKTRII